MELLTDRFLLRDFLPADAAAFAAYHTDPRYAHFYTEDVADPAHAAGLLATFREWATQEPRLNYQLAVVQRAEPHALIGCVGVRRAGQPPGHAEFGIELAPDHWGRHGYAVEIGRGLLDFAFRDLKVGVVTGSTVAANTRISRLAAWFGAEMVMNDSGDWRAVQWRLTRERWEQRAPRVL